MSSTESSGAPAEASATSPASNAAPSFGSTRGSGLSRGKAKRPAAPAAATAASSDYTPTAIEVVTAPREYQNPFAPAETPAAAQPEPVKSAPVAKVDPVTTELKEPAPVVHEAPQRIEPDAGLETDEPAALNILEPERQKTAPAQTWESEGFRPARESRNDRPRREESRRDEPRREERAPRQDAAPAEPFDPSTVPAKFLYVRPGYNYVPTPSNYGGAPREPREPRPASTGSSYSAPAASSAPAKSGGFFGWLKSLFGGSTEAAPAAVETRNGGSSEYRNGGDRHRGGGGRGRGGQGGGDGQRRRSRGGRGRSGGGGGYRPGGGEGSSQGGSI